MNRLPIIRTGIAAGASLAIHLVVFAAVGPADTDTKVADGAKIHFGTPPGSHKSEDAKPGQPEPLPASMRVPETKVPEPEPETHPKPTPLPPEPSTKTVKPKPSPIPPPKPEPVPADASEKPVEDVPRKDVPEADAQALAETGDTTDPVSGEAVEARADAGEAAATSGEVDDTSSGPGNAASTNYAGLVMQHLSKVRRPRASSPGSAFVSFTISRKGELEDVRISRSSRSARFDRDAIMVVRKAAPFPTPPPDVNRSFSVEIKGR